MLEDAVICTPEIRAFAPEYSVHRSVTATRCHRFSRRDAFEEGTKLPGVSVRRCATAVRYHIEGCDDEDQLTRFARQYLANEVVEQWSVNDALSAPFADGASVERTIETVAVIQLNDEDLLALSVERRLSLDLNEMKTIRNYYAEVGREPTDLELEMLAQTWSEHCVHKTFKAKVDYREIDADGAVIEGSQRIVDSMIRTYLKGATDNCGKDFIRSAFVDNAGIVRFDEEFDPAIKAETHNHPSALEPFGGSNTGVGGVVRDILGVSARPLRIQTYCVSDRRTRLGHLMASCILLGLKRGW